MNRKCFYNHEKYLTGHMNDYKVMSDQVNNCSTKIKNFKISKLINAGGFGSIYAATGSLKSKKMNLILKIIRQKKKDIKFITDEIQMSTFLGSKSLGPNIYDAFYVENFISKDITQYIIMDYIKGRLVEFCSETKIKEMIINLHRQIYIYNVFSLPVHLDNFYIDSKNKVKFIDINNSVLWTLPNLPIKYHDKKLEIFYALSLLQLYIELSVSKYLRPFHKDPIFSSLIRNRNTIKEVLDLDAYSFLKRIIKTKYKTVDNFMNIIERNMKMI